MDEKVIIDRIRRDIELYLDSADNSEDLAAKSVELLRMVTKEELERQRKFGN